MLAAIKEISTIIERDSKDTTYKFALLRACIEITQDYEHFAIIEKGQVTFPLGLIVLKWIEYYYAIFEDTRFIPQKNGDTPKRTLAFRNSFNEIIYVYKEGLGYYQFQRDLKDGKLDDKNKQLAFNLIRIIKATITKMPMNYIGSAVNKRGLIFKYNKDSKFSLRNIDILTDQTVIETCGSFSMPKNYFDAFSLLGSFINGKKSLLLEWVDFTIRVDKEYKFSRGELLGIIDPMYDKERDVNEMKSFYEKLKVHSDLFCIWSGEKIINDLNIDHVMPYSLWKNNDYWNLLPTKSNVNSRKSNKIPSFLLLKQQKDLILYYWEIAYETYPIRFKKELQISLLGLTPFNNNWKNKSFESLMKKCNYLINQRGLEPFNV